MASFRSKFQILGVKSSKENGYQLLKSSSPLKGTFRSFWFLKSKDKPIEYGRGNCGEPLPPCMDLICKNCPSKCLEYAEKSSWKKLFSFKRQKPVKEKPSNYKIEEKPREEPLTWWETIFGPDPKRSWPDPCTCRVAHRVRRRKRQYDPRLSDKRYQQTAGDVLLYTEPVKRRSESCLEPQPKSPPGYKVPKAVVVGMMSVFADKAPLSLLVLDDQPPKDDNNGRITSFKIPYEELRPPDKRRRSFICRRGILPEDVEPPINRDLNPYRLSQQTTFERANLLKNLRYPEKKSEKTLEDKVDLTKRIPRRSRIEQLKILIAEKDMPEYNKPPNFK